mmetsp:Transcript_46627/g.117444  ORF Transcript_46627/g.117444 Transcript_46627/m.117444 type:complete len:254 (-) Transcript_46627:65-826(-)
MHTRYTPASHSSLCAQPSTQNLSVCRGVRIKPPAHACASASPPHARASATTAPQCATNGLQAHELCPPSHRASFSVMNGLFFSSSGCASHMCSSSISAHKNSRFTRAYSSSFLLSFSVRFLMCCSCASRTCSTSLTALFVLGRMTSSRRKRCRFFLSLYTFSYCRFMRLSWKFMAADRYTFPNSSNWRRITSDSRRLCTNESCMGLRRRAGGPVFFHSMRSSSGEECGALDIARVCGAHLQRARPLCSMMAKR